MPVGCLGLKNDFPFLFGAVHDTRILWLHIANMISDPALTSE